MPAKLLSAANLRAALARETYALPVDFLRVLVGLLSFVYFLRTYLEAGDFSNPDGLIDHALLFDILWFTRLGFFQLGMPLELFEGVFLFACVVSWALVLGIRPKTSAAVLFLIAVSTYRWNFIVMYVDDAIMHLLLFWMLLLPVGKTLRLRQWLRDRGDAWRRWRREVVPGAPVTCFLGNLALLYLVAGLWKFDSPMWRDGTALYAILKLPISYAPDFWTPDDLPWLKVAGYFGLVLEPLIPLVFVLPKGHLLKWLVLPAILSFHLGIIFTLRIPFANLGCLAALVLVFRGELMDRVLRGSPQRPVAVAERIGLSGRFSIAFLIVLSIAMLRRIPVIDDVHKPAYAVLYVLGIAQDYQLFNWIDRKNFHAKLEARVLKEKKSRGINPEDVFPRSIRHVLLQSYLHNVRWIKIPEERRKELKQSIYRRYARRYCRLHAPDGAVSVLATVQRLTADNLRLERGIWRLLLRFSSRDGKPDITYMRLQGGLPMNRPPRVERRRKPRR